MSHESPLKSSPKILHYSENNEIFVRGGSLAAPCPSDNAHHGNGSVQRESHFISKNLYEF